jgi:hypothetical protein
MLRAYSITNTDWFAWWSSFAAVATQHLGTLVPGKPMDGCSRFRSI